MKGRLALCFLLLAAGAAALEVPPTPRTYFTDFAQVVPASQARQIDAELAGIEQRTGHQVLAVIFPSLDGESLEDFTIRCAERWKVGRKGLDDGVIFFAFLSQRRMRLEVGYGLEGKIPDALSGRLLDLVKPHFARGDYGGGVLALAGALEKLFKGEPVPKPRKRGNGSPLGGLFPLLFFIFISFILGRLRRRGVRRSGIFWGGFGGGFGGGGFGGGGFSGGGGSFGGGGASGSW